MGLDPNEIYVDLSSAGTLGPTDSNGAPLCGNSAIDAGGLPIGTYSFPLSFEQLRLYIQYRLNENDVGNTTRTFIIKGVIETDVDFTGHDYTGPSNLASVFTALYPSDPSASYTSYTVVFKNWETDKSYKMKLSSKFSGDILNSFTSVYPRLVFLQSNNVTFKFNSMDVQTGILTDDQTSKELGNIAFHSVSPFNSDGSKSNNIYLDNCRIYTHGGGVGAVSKITVGGQNVNIVVTGTEDTEYVYNISHYFSGYIGVKLTNCLFYSSTTDNTLLIRDYPINNSWDWSYNTINYILINSIFLNISNVYRGSYGSSINNDDGYLYTRGCVFSGDKSDYLDGIDSNLIGYVINILFDDNYNQFEFGLPTPPGSWDIMSMTDDDYNYFKYGWENIIPDLAIKGNDNESVYGVRDGIGPLYFIELISPVMTVDDRLPVIGQTVIFSNTIVDYDTTYQPSYYGWSIYKPSNVYIYDFDINGSLSYVVDESGIYEVYMYAFSHNKWYVSSYSNLLNIKVEFNSSMDIILLNSDGIETDTFDVFDDITLSATNTTNLPYSTTNSLGVDWGEEFLDDTFSYGTISDDNQSKLGYNDSYVETYTYYAVGDYVVKFAANFIDGSKYFYYLPINVHDNISEVKYVDLSIEWEDTNWLDLNYGVFDTFEGGYISNQWNPTFLSQYNVKNMWGDDIVAYGTDLVRVYDAIGYGDYIFDFSFVRTDEDDKPSVSINMVNDSFIAVSLINIKWDYIKDSLLFNINGDEIRIKYGEFIKDVSCAAALKTIYVKGSFDIDNEILTLYYKLKSDDDWITTNIIDINIFYRAFIDVQCTMDSGLGYLRVQHNELLSTSVSVTGKGTPDYPYTYTEMITRMMDGMFPINTKLLCRNQRVVTESIYIPSNLYYEIDAWDSQLYGPWVLIGSVSNDNINLSGVKLSNGIIYDYIDNKSNLVISKICDMFIVWNGLGKVLLDKRRWKYTETDNRVDIKGSTVRSINGFSMYEEV